MRQAIGNLLKLAVMGGLAYMVYDWQTSKHEDGDATAFAKRACLDEAGSRYELAKARVYDVTKNDRGYVVRISATLARGKPVKVTCLANPHGGVSDVLIDER